MGFRSGLHVEMMSHVPEPLFHNFSLINLGIVILQYARVIREEEIYCRLYIMPVTIDTFTLIFNLWQYAILIYHEIFIFLFYTEVRCLFFCKANLFN